MENKKEIKIEEKKGNLFLENRRRLTLTGVVDVVSFNEENILLDTNLGALLIKGNGLKMNKLDVQNGEVTITGSINSFNYTGSESKQNKESIISKLFK